jgi:hypothetical protein
VTFTLYGIDGIGTQLEDPFGYDRNDIKMDAIIEDSRQEIMVVLNEWKKGPVETEAQGTGPGVLTLRAGREMFAVDETVTFFQA